MSTSYTVKLPDGNEYGPVDLATLRGDAFDLAGRDTIGLDRLARQLADSGQGLTAQRQPPHLEDVLADLSLCAEATGSC